jgi:hypothetical protein
MLDLIGEVLFQGGVRYGPVDATDNVTRPPGFTKGRVQVGYAAGVHASVEIICSLSRVTSWLRLPEDSTLQGFLKPLNTGSGIGPVEYR